MTLTAADIAQIMRLVEQSTFDELNLEIDGIKLTLRRSGAGGAVTQNMTTQQSLSDAAAAGAAAAGAVAAGTTAGTTAGTAAGGTPAAGVARSANSRDIASPMLGTFYRAPKPGSAPFVEVGSPVEENSVIAIIEVMKLMNTVRAGVKGVITEILPADETLVEFGQVLMRARVDA